MSGSSRSETRQSGGSTIPNLWTDEHHAQLQSQARDMLASQYGNMAAELHRQLVTGQLTPAQYASGMTQFKAKKAGAMAGASRDLDIERVKSAQTLATQSAQLAASSKNSSFSTSGSRGAAKDDLRIGGSYEGRSIRTNKDLAAAAAMQQGYRTAGAIRKVPGAIERIKQAFPQTAPAF
ncbi:MAG TPA: hypothetical protein VFH61_05295, partial [Thermoleophilia bacterium]|nr:hypothetical protein [Thermoleophilia bacterium]